MANDCTHRHRGFVVVVVAWVFFGAWVFLLVLVGVWWEFNAFLSNLKYISILGFIFA